MIARRPVSLFWPLLVAFLGVMAPSLVRAASNGVNATYYYGQLSWVQWTTTDSQIAWYWGGDGPGNGDNWSDDDGNSGWDNFSMRWTGYIQVPNAGTYTFHTYTDDGVRLWINGALVIDQWHDMGMTTYSTGQYTLAAGQSVSFQMEYYENGGDAGAYLQWSGPGVGTQTTIPWNYLFTTDPHPLTPQTVNFTNPGTHNLNDSFTLSATATSGGPITYSVVAGGGSISGSTFTATTGGSITIRATQAGSATYQAAYADQTFTVNRANQTITFNNPGTRTYTDAPFALSATSSSGLAVTFGIVSGPATVSGSNLTITGAGTIVVAANQSGNTSYNAATQVTQTFTANKANQTISGFATIVDKSAAAPPFSVSASSSSGQAVVFSIVSGPATISGTTITLTGALGTVVVAADQAGNANYNAAPRVTQSFNVTGQPIVTSATSATGTVNTPFTFTITGGPNATLFYVGGGTLPAGLTLNSSTGAITGTPTQQGIFTLTANVGNSYGVSTAPLTITIYNNDGYQRAFLAAATNTQSQAPTIALTFVHGSLYPYGSNWYSVTDLTDGSSWGPYYFGSGNTSYPGSSYGATTMTWTDPRGISYAGAHTFQFTAYSYYGNYGPLVTSATSVVSGPTGYISAFPTHSGGGPVSFTVTVANAGYGSGINRIRFTDTGSGSAWDAYPTAITGTGTYSWSDPRGASAYTGTRTWTITAFGSGYQLAPVSVSASLVSSSTSITVNPGGGGLLTVPAGTQPSFTVTIRPADRWTDDGQHTNDYVYYIQTYPSTGGQTYTVANPYYWGAGPWTSGLWSDPRGGLAAGTYSYVVKTVGYRMDPYANDWGPDDDGNYGTDYGFNWNWADPLDSTTVTFTVVNGTPQTVTFNNPGPQNFGAAPFNLVATASSGLPVSFTVVSGPATISGSTITLTGPGNVTVAASQPGNGSYAAAASVQQSFTVLKSPQTITFTNPGTRTIGATLNLASFATTTSGLALSYSATGNVSLSGQNLTLLAPGPVTVTAYQAGNASVMAATPVSISFNVINGQAQTITFGSLGGKIYGDAPFAVTATADSGLPVSFNITSGPATISGNTVTVTGTGTVLVQAVQGGNSTYNPASPVSQSFTVSKANQTITFPNPGTRTYLDAPITLGATASSGLAVTYSIASGPATVSGSSLTITGAGVVTVNANQSGNGNYNAAAQVQQSFTVNKANQTISFPTITDKSYANSPFTISATASSGLPCSFSIVSGPATVSGSTITMTGTTGPVVVQASQVGNANYNPASLNQTFQATGQPAITNGNYTVQSGYSANFYFTASPAATTYSVNGALPAGLTLNSSTGLISGATSAIGIYNLTENVGNTYGVTSAPFLLRVVDGYQMSFGAVQSSSPTQPPAFALTLYYGGYQYSGYGGNSYSVTDLSDGTQWNVSLPAAPSGGGTSWTGTWQDPRGLSYTGTRSYQFRSQVYSTTYGWMYTTTTALATVYGPPGYISVSPTVSQGIVTFQVGVANNNYGTGITSIAFRDNSTGQTFSQTVSAITGTGTYAWTDSRGAYVGTRSWTITASGSGYQLPSVTLNVTGTASTGNVVVLTPTSGSTSIPLGTTPTFTTVLRPTDRWTDDGQHTNDYVYYVQSYVQGYGGWYTITNPYYWGAGPYTVGSWGDPRGAVGVGTYTYQVVALGYRMTPYANDWGPDDDGNYGTDYGFNWDWAFDPNSNNLGSASITFTVASGTQQTISFPNPGTRTFGDAPFALSASASSGLAPTFSVVSGPASISGTTITLTGAGSVVVRASQAGNGSFAAAPPVDQTFNVMKAAQTITFNTIPQQTVGAVVNLSSFASASSGLPLSFIVSGNANLNGNNLTITGVGSVTIQAAQPGNGSYMSAISNPQTFTTVNGQPQTITFPNPGTKTYLDAPFALTATSDSGLPVSYAVTSGPATISGSTLTITGAGAVSIVATQAGNGTYNAANPVTQSFTVNKAAQTLNFSLSSRTFLDPPFTVSATSSAGLTPITFSVVSGPISISGTTVTITGAGTATIRASQAGNANYAAINNDQTFSIAKANQTITSFPALSDRSMGSLPFAVTATTSSGLAPVFSIVSGPATISGSTVTMTGSSGAVTVQVDQPGNANYNAAPPLQQTFNALQIPALTSAANVTGTQNQALTYNSTTSPAAISFSLYGNIPPGLSINATTGVISGTPTSSGVFNFFINTGNANGILSNPVTFTINSAYGFTIGAVAINPSNQPAKFTVNYNDNYWGAAYIGAGYYGLYSYTVYDQSTGANLGTNYIAWTADNQPHSQTWTDSRGFAFTGTRTFRFDFSGFNGSYWVSSSTYATTTVTGPPGYIVPIQSNQSQTGAPTFSIAVFNNGYSTGITAIDVSSPFGTQTIPVGPIINTSTVTWGSPWSNGGTYNYTFTARGSGYTLAPVTVSAVNNAGSTGITLTPSTGSLTLSSGSQPTLNIFAHPADRYADDGQHTNDYIYYIQGYLVGYSGWYSIINPYTQSNISTSWADPRGGLAAGSYTYQVKTVGYRMDPYANDWGPDDDGNYGTDYGFNWNWADPLDQASITFTIINGTAQTINFPNPGTRTFGDAPFALNATASSGLAVTLSVVSGPATLSGNTLTLTGGGVVTVQASQAGNATYAAAPSVVQSFAVGKTSQTITFPAIGNVVAGGSATLTASSSSGLPVTYSVVSGPASISGSTVTTIGSGTVVVQADQPGNANYMNALPVQRSFNVVNGQPQTISFGALANKVFGAAPFTVSATASSGLTVIFTVVSGPATISGTTVTITGTGTVTIQATQSGNTTYLPAPAVTQSFSVSQASQTISFPAIANQVYGVSPFAAGATASSGLPVSYSVMSGPATVSGSTITITGTGTVTLQATQAGNANYLAASSVNQSFTVSPANQTITFGALSNRFYGDVFALTATASSGLPINYSVTSGPATVSGSTVTVTGIGTVTITAAQPGNANYNAASSVSQTFTTSKANQTITFGTIPSKNYGDVFNLSATATSSLPVSYVVTSGPATISGNQVTITGIGSVTITASQPGDTNWNAATSVPQTFSAGQATQTISFGSLASRNYGDVFSVTATASSGLPVAFAIASGPATISGSTVTVTGVGSVTVTASQAGNTNYAAASPVSQSFTTNKANQTISFSALGGKIYGDAPFTVSATSTSGLPVTFAVTSGPATISGNTVTITGGGTVTITASQAGNANYNAASNVPQSFTVAAASQTISFGALAGKNYGDAAFSLTATASSGLPVAFSVVSGPATISGSLLTITGAGTVTVQATQAGNSNYASAPAVNQSFTVAKVTPTGTWSGRSLVTSASTYAATAGDLNASFAHPFNVGSTTAPTGAISYSVVGSGATVTAGTTFNVNTTYTIRASYPGDQNYNSTTADAVWNIVPPPPAIGSQNSVNAVASQPFSFQATATFQPTSWTATGLPTGYSINNAGMISGTTSSTGTFNVNLTATNAGGSGTQALTINVYLQPAFTSSMSPVIKLNVPFTYTLTATGNPTSFTATNLPPGVTLNATTGVISGTPSTVGNYSVPISAANPGATTPGTLTLNVAQTYTLTVSANPSAGGSAVGAGVFDPGATANLNAVPNASYRFGSWGGADGDAVASQAASTTIVMNSNRTVQAMFVAQAVVTVNAGAGGTASGTGSYDIGSSAPITATPNSGYYFTGWTGTGVANPLAASTSVSIPGAVTVTASFASLGGVASSGTITFPSAVPSGQSGASATTSSMTAAVSNTGSSALNVVNLTASGDFAPTVTLPFSVPAGSSIDVPVTFAPRALGSRTGMFTLVTNDSQTVMMVFNLQGTGTNPNQPPTVNITAANGAYSGSPMTVSSTASAPNMNLTLHSIESMSPGGSWTVNVVAAAGASSNRTIGVVFPTNGAWTLRAGASTDNGATWTYSSSIVVNVTDGLINYSVQTMAVPNSGMEKWYAPSTVTQKTFQVQRTNP